MMNPGYQMQGISHNPTVKAGDDYKTESICSTGHLDKAKYL